jgi:hypothetical protein
VFGEALLPMILYKLGPGRLLFADRLTHTPASQYTPPMPGTENLIRATAQQNMPIKAD